MTKEEFAKVFVNSKINDISALLEEAYLEGYKKGEENNINKINIDGIEFFDPGVPSGTLWSCAPQYFNYGWHLERKTFYEVEKLSLPTKEQWEELLEYCQVDELHIITRYGDKLGYPIADNSPSNRYTTYTLGEKCEKNLNKFWMAGSPDDKGMIEVILFDRDVIGYDTHFSGYKLPFFMVKNKANL